MSGESGGNKIGVVPATLMVAGNMMGSGVFMLPANLAGIGGVAILGWVVTCIGAIALALTFSKLATIDPSAGGPYAYTKHAFGDYMGFQTNLIYWLANVIGNVGLSVVGLGYLSNFIPGLKSPLIMAVAQVCIIWLFSYINMVGPKLVGRVQTITTSMALIPIVATAVLGWFWFKPSLYLDAWNVTGKGTVSAVGMTLNFTLWAFIGVESASVSAGVVEDPKKNVPIATIGGVIIAAVCYVLGSTVIMGMIPNKDLISSAAPFADAARLAFGNIAGNAVALFAAMGCLGSLAGWTLLVGQSAKAAADDGLFPDVFARTNNKGVPSAGLAIVAVIMSVIVFATASPSASQQFGKLSSIAVIMTLLPYVYSCVALRILGKDKLKPKDFNLYSIIGIVAAVYSLAALVTSDGEETRWSLIFVIATIIFYVAMVSHKRKVDADGNVIVEKSPRWVRYTTLVITLATLAVTFALTVGKTESQGSKHRTNITVTQEGAADQPGGTSTQVEEINGSAK